MLKEKNYIGFEWYKNGNQNRFKKYLFKCLNCSNIIKAKKCEFSKHTGNCLPCSAKETIKIAQQYNRLRPFEARYNIFLSKIKDEPIKTDITYLDYVEFTNIKNCHYCDKFMDWKPFDNNPGFWLDRKNNNLYHTKDNLVVCCGDCNKTKRDYFTYEEFLLLSPVLKQIRANKSK